jgi:hypothetical protein
VGDASLLLRIGQRKTTKIGVVFLSTTSAMPDSHRGIPPRHESPLV